MQNDVSYNEMKNNEIEHIEKVLDLAQDLNQEIEKTKLCFEDTETSFDLNKYLDTLFDKGYNYLRDADIDCDEEDVALSLSNSSSKDLIISLIMTLCTSRIINLSDMILHLDILKDQDK